MKSYTFPLFLALVIISCGHDGTITRKQKNDNGSITTTSMNLSPLPITADDVNQKIEDLKKLTPLTPEQLKSLLPEILNGIRRSHFNTNSMMGISVAEANYEQGEKDLKLAIYDCAGEAGAGIFALSYVTQMNMQSESDNGYTRTMDFNGAKAVEAYEKNSNQSTFTYIVNDRLMVVLTGKNIDNAALKQVAQNLNFKV